MTDQRPDDHDRPNPIPHDLATTAACPNCWWPIRLCHCPEEGSDA